MSGGAGDNRERVSIVPVTVPVANRYVAKLHRHHAAIPGGFAWFCCAAVVGSRIVGVAIAGRPTNRNNDDRQTVEVLRVATDGTPNTSSALLGACARAAQAIGARRIITYTLTTESGASLRGAGWENHGETGKSFWGNANTRTPAVNRGHFDVPKTRWEKRFRDAIAYDDPQCPSDDAAQPDLFGAAVSGG